MEGFPIKECDKHSSVRCQRKPFAPNLFRHTNTSQCVSDWISNRNRIGNCILSKRTEIEIRKLEVWKCLLILDYPPWCSFMCGLYSISDVLPVSLSHLSYHLPTGVQDWPRVVSIWPLLIPSNVNFVGAINAWRQLHNLHKTRHFFKSRSDFFI